MTIEVGDRLPRNSGTDFQKKLLMLKNFLMTIKRYKVASVLNIAGLTLSMVAFYIIAAQV